MEGCDDSFLLCLTRPDLLADIVNCTRQLAFERKSKMLSREHNVHISEYALLFKLINHETSSQGSKADVSPAANAVQAGLLYGRWRRES